MNLAIESGGAARVATDERTALPDLALVASVKKDLADFGPHETRHGGFKRIRPVRQWYRQE